MTQYSDVPTANALYLENEQVNNAITMIDTGGLLINFAITPPPAMAGSPASTMMATAINVPPPVDPALMAALRSWLVSRSAEIEAELVKLEVTDPPAVRR